MLAESLSHVRQRIEQACQRCGRDPQAVQLVCVTKTVPVDVIQQTISLGVKDFGENRVQEANAKIAMLATSRVRWHLVGHLQHNKAKDAVELFDVIHSVDSAELAEELERQATKRRTDRRPLEIFVQANVSGEATKFGCKPEETGKLAERIQQLPHLQLRGLMTMPPFSNNPEDARPHFRRLRKLRDVLTLNSQLSTPNLLLSMGMSNDFEVAIEEGAGVIRVGTAIFGPR